MKNFSKFVLLLSCLFMPIICLADIAPMPMVGFSKDAGGRFITYFFTGGMLSLVLSLVMLLEMLNNQHNKTTEKTEKQLTSYKKCLKISLNILLGLFAFLSFGLIILLSAINKIVETLILISPSICIIMSSIIIINIAVKKRNLPNKLLRLVPIAVYLLTTPIAGWAYIHYYEIEDYLLSERCDKCKKYYRDKHSCWYCNNHKEYFNESHKCFYCFYHNDWHIQHYEKGYYDTRTGHRYNNGTYWKTSSECKTICNDCGNDYTHLIHGREYNDNIIRGSISEKHCKECGVYRNDHEIQTNTNTW